MSAVKKNSKRQARQYMNRKGELSPEFACTRVALACSPLSCNSRCANAGGFNRELPKEVTGEKCNEYTWH